MTTLYKPFGCFNNLSNDAFSTNLTELTNKKYSIKECNKAAIDNNSSAFGIVNDETNNLGSCFLSDSNLSPLQQSFQAVKGGTIVNGCQDNFGNKEKKSVFVYLNDKAITFFKDISSVNVLTSEYKEIGEYYSSELYKLNIMFEKLLNNFKTNTENKLKSYEYNDLNNIFEKSDYSDIEIVNDRFIGLYDSITIENSRIFNEIKKVNKEIQGLDDYIINSTTNIENVKTSNNAALGNLTDMNFRLNSINGENIVIVIIPLILIVLYLKEKNM